MKVIQYYLDSRHSSYLSPDMSHSTKLSSDIKMNNLDDDELDNDAGSMHSMPLSDKEISSDKPHEIKEPPAAANISALDKLQAIVNAASQQSPKLDEEDEDSPNESQEMEPSMVYPATAFTLDSNHEYDSRDTHPKSTAIVTPAKASRALAANPISPVTPSAYYKSAPLSAGPLSSIPSAASNAPFIDRSPSPTTLEHGGGYGLSRETDGSTSALRDVLSSKPVLNDNVSISSETQRKLRPESVLMPLTRDPLVLGIALVDFDHAVSTTILRFVACT
jgi:hypothetical protein